MKLTQSLCGSWEHYTVSAAGGSLNTYPTRYRMVLGVVPASFYDSLDMSEPIFADFGFSPLPLHIRPLHRCETTKISMGSRQNRENLIKYFEWLKTHPNYHRSLYKKVLDWLQCRDYNALTYHMITPKNGQNQGNTAGSTPKINQWTIRTHTYIVVVSAGKYPNSNCRHNLSRRKPLGAGGHKGGLAVR